MASPGAAVAAALLALALFALGAALCLRTASASRGCGKAPASLTNPPAPPPPALLPLDDSTTLMVLCELLSEDEPGTPRLQAASVTLRGR